MINMATMTTLFIARCESFAIADARYNEKEKKSRYSKASILKILGRVSTYQGSIALGRGKDLTTISRLLLFSRRATMICCALKAKKDDQY